MLSRRPRRIEQILTLGVEEEFVLVDPATRYTVPRGAEVLAPADVRLPGRFGGEFYATQVEARTEPVDQAGRLRDQLVQGRHVLAEAARRAGCRLVASGSAVLTSSPLRVVDDRRYATMIGRYAETVSRVDSESSGCHIHLGTLDRPEAVALGTGMRPWLPVLQALAANSPFAAGRFRNCASWRHYQQQAWPTVGPAPPLDGEAYERLAADLVRSGVLLDRAMIYWYARPSEHLPTLEIRVPDVNADVDVEVLVALLARALGMILLADLRAGVETGRPSDGELREAHRQAAVHGLAGRWVHPVTGRTTTLAAGLGVLAERARPALMALDEERLVDGLLRRVAECGTGDHRQRAVYHRRGSLADVVDDLAAWTVRG